MNNGRRVVNTREGEERRGALRIGPWEVEGDGYLYLLAGALVSLLAWAVLARTGMPWWLRVPASALPLLCAVGWLRWMVVGRPPAFASDVCDTVIEGRDFWTEPQRFSRWARLGSAAAPGRREGRR
jgi:hypothetical protein